MKLSPIFPAHIKPVHEGVYKVFQLDAPHASYARWHGVWGVARPSAKDAEDQSPESFFADQDKSWQGVIR